MHPLLQQLYDNPDFQGASNEAQKQFILEDVVPQIFQEPAFAQASPEALRGVLNDIMSFPPALTNKALENELWKISDEYASGNWKQRSGPHSGGGGIEGSRGLIYNINNEFLQGNAITGLVSKYIIDPVKRAFGGENAPSTFEALYGDDKQKANAYVKSLLASEGDSMAMALGVGSSFLGTIADWVAVGAAEAPIVGRIAAAGASRFAPKLLQMFPNMNARTLVTAAEILAPQVADAVMDGILNIPREEFMAGVKGEESPMSKGVLEVMKNFGIGAAFDFGLGTAISYATMAPGILKKVFSGTPHKSGQMSLDDLDNAILRLRNGTLPQERWNLLDEKMQAFAIQQAKIGDFLDDTAHSQDTQAMGRLYLLAQDTGSIVDARAEGAWKLYSPVEGGFTVQTTKDYLGTLNKLSDDAYNVWKKLEPGKKENFMRSNEWALNYGASRNASKELMDSLEATKIKGAPLDANKNSFTVSSSEADALIRGSSPEGMIAFKVGADFEDAVLRVSKGDPNILPSAGKEIIPDPNGQAVVLLRKVASPQEFEAATLVAKKANLIDPNVPVEQYRRAYLMSSGYDGAQLPEGKMLVLSDNAFKMIMSDEALSAGKSLKKGFGNPIPNNIKASLEVDSVLKGRALISDRKALTDAVLKVARDLNEKDATNLARAYLADTEMDLSKVNVHIVKKDNFVSGSRMVVRNGTIRDGALDIYLPERITTQGAERRFIYDFLGSMDTIVRESGVSFTKTPRKRALDTLAAKSDLRFEIPRGPGVQSETWLSSVVDALGGKASYVDGKYRLTFQGGPGNMDFNSLDEAIDFTARLTITPDVLKEDLLLKGIRLTESADGTLSVVGKNIDGRITANSVPELLAKMNYLPSRLDVRYGPKEVAIVDEGVQIGGQVFTGTRKTVLQMLDKFEDKLLKAQSSLVGDFGKGTVWKGPDGSFKVEVPQMKFQKHFDSLRDARKFVDDLDTLPILQEVAEKKGFMLRMGAGGEFVAYGAGKKIVAKDQESLFSLFTDYPDPEVGAPSLFAATNPEVDIQAKDILRMYKATDFPESKPLLYHSPMDAENANLMGPWMMLKSYSSRTMKWMEDYARTVDGSFLPLYRKMEEGLKNASIEMNEALKIVDSIFVDAGGKRIPLKRRKELFAYMGELERGATNPEEIFRHINAPVLSAREHELVDQVRNYWDKLGTKFGIKSQDVIFNYRSRILDWYHTANKEIVNKMTNASEMTEAIFGTDRVGREMKAFFENARVSDLLDFAAKDDLLEVMTQYTVTGMKKYHLNDAWRDVDNYLKHNIGTLAPDTVKRINYYREAIMGYNKTDVERGISRLGEAAFGKLYDNKLFGLPLRATGVSRDEFTKVGRNILGVFSGLQSLAAMGFKPALALRNYTQVYSVLGGRVGLSRVHRAVKETLEGGEDYYRWLRGIGEISDAPPLVNEIYLGEGKFSKLQEKAMGWFTNSDQLSRAVSIKVGSDYIDDALRLRRTTPGMSAKQFSEVAGLDLVPPDVRDQVLGLVAKGTDVDLASAKMVLGDYWNQSTMFSYTKADAPMMFQGLIGKAFGQFGTYSAGYRAVLSDGVRYGGAAFATRFVGINMALWGATYAAGMKFNDYVPLMPAVFTGGPLFDLGVNLIQSMDLQGYEGKQARAKALDGMMRLAPGTSQLAYFKKAVEYADQGDSWKAFLALTSTPTRNE